MDYPDVQILRSKVQHLHIGIKNYNAIDLKTREL
jgi:hypothetical protein